MKFKLTISTLCILFYLNIASAQCPVGITLSTNGNCFYLSWSAGNVPSPLPTSIVFNSSNFTFVSGSGTTASPANYSNGNCPNSTPNPFSGTLTINGQLCNYLAGALPIELENYKILENEQIAYVQWTTLSETNVDRFEIYTSSDNINWNLDNTLKAKGNSNYNIDYKQEINRLVNTNIVYVKVIEVDYDGLMFEFEVLNHSYSGDDLPKFFPNPFHEKIYFDQNAKFQLLSIRDLSNKEHTGKVKITQDCIDFTLLPNGMYLIELGTLASNKVYKVIKY